MKASLVLLGLKHRLNAFKRTGEVFQKSPKGAPTQITRQKVPDSFKANSLSTAIKLLRNQYDGLIYDQNNKIMDLLKISTKDLTNKSNRSKNLLIFKNLMKLKSIDKKPIDKRILLMLLGVNIKQLKDKVLITKTTEKLLQQDGNIERAKYLLRLSHHKNPVSLNRVTDYLLQERQHTQQEKLENIDEAIKLINDGKKWGYKLNEQSYVILFNGISKKLDYGEATESICQKSLNLFNKLHGEESATIPIFNSLLSLLLKNLDNDQDLAWSLFNSLNNKMRPNVQTFTIFLNGVNEYRKIKFDEIKKKDLIKAQKKLLYYKASNEWFELAELIKAKTLTVGKIDKHFMNIYLNSFINEYGELGHNYANLGLKQLINWFPELNDLPHERPPVSDFALEFSKEYRQAKDYEFAKTVNDNTELTSEDALQPYQRKTAFSLTSEDHNELEINHFMLQKFIEGLSQLEKPDQFINMIWKLIQKYCGVEFVESLPDVKREIYDVKIQHDIEFTTLDKPIDEKLIEFIIFKINQVYLKETKASSICIHLLDYIQPIFTDTDGLVKGIISVMNEEFHYFVRLNRNTIRTSMPKRKQILTKNQLSYLITNLGGLIQKHQKAIESNSEIKQKLVKLVSNLINAFYVEISHLSETIALNQSIIDCCSLLVSDESIATVLKPCFSVVKNDQKSSDPY